jgi:hypothetical protein
MPLCLGSTTRFRAGLWHAVAFRDKLGPNLGRLMSQARGTWRRACSGQAPWPGLPLPAITALRCRVWAWPWPGYRVLLAGSCLLFSAVDASAERYGDWDRDRSSAPWWQQQDLWPDRGADTDSPGGDAQDWRRPLPGQSAPSAREAQDRYRFRGDPAPSDDRPHGRSESSHGGWRFREDPKLDALTEPTTDSGYRFRPPTERERSRWADEGGRGLRDDYRWRPGPRPRLPYGEDDATFGYSPNDGGVD